MKARKKETEKSIKDTIIRAAIECMEKSGLHSLTVRSIAGEAGVNLAAINYYFGSKDKLIEEVFRQTLYTGFEENIDDFLIKYRDTPKQALEMFFLEMLGGGLKYPNLVKIHFYDAFVNNNYKTNSVKRLNSFLKDFERHLFSLMPALKKEIDSKQMVQFWSAVFFPIIFPALFREYAGFDIRDSEHQKEYVAKLLKLYFEV